MDITKIFPIVFSVCSLLLAPAGVEAHGHHSHVGVSVGTTVSAGPSHPCYMERHPCHHAYYHPCCAHHCPGRVVVVRPVCPCCGYYEEVYYPPCPRHDFFSIQWNWFN